MVFVVFRLLVWSLQAVLVDVRAVPGDVKSHREEQALWLNYDCVCYPPWIAWMLLQRAVGRPAMVSTVQKIVQAELIFRTAKNRTRKITFPNMSNLACFNHVWWLVELPLIIKVRFFSHYWLPTLPRVWPCWHCSGSRSLLHSCTSDQTLGWSGCLAAQPRWPIPYKNLVGILHLKLAWVPASKKAIKYQYNRSACKI